MTLQMYRSAGRLMRAVGLIAFGATWSLSAHTMDLVELPNDGGIQIFTDGNLLNFFPGVESAIVGANFNDGDYTPQLINVNLYDDPAHTILSDTIDITVPAQNPGQITVGLDSAAPGMPLALLTPETLGLTEATGLQTITTLTNQRGIQTTIRVQSDPNPIVATPEPATFATFLIGFIGLAAVACALRCRRPANA
jgi:hypothetical protein